jgi:predicted alpha/beta hydrolase family esterase
MRDLKDLTILILSGLHGAGPDHWQTAWQQSFPSMQRVEQMNWERPVYADWSARLTEAVAQAPRPIVLVAHSLGTSLTMRWSFEQGEHAKKVAGAFLVAPTDRDRFDASPSSPVRGWGLMILERLPFPSMVIASRNDDRVSFDRAEVFAKAWGSDAGGRRQPRPYRQRCETRALAIRAFLLRTVRRFAIEGHGALRGCGVFMECARGQGTGSAGRPQTAFCKRARLPEDCLI